MSNYNPKYKVVLCKHYNSIKGCVYGDKCQFAHGEHELKSQVTLIISNLLRETNLAQIIQICTSTTRINRITGIRVTLM